MKTLIDCSYCNGFGWYYTERDWYSNGDELRSSRCECEKCDGTGEVEAEEEDDEAEAA